MIVIDDFDGLIRLDHGAVVLKPYTNGGNRTFAAVGLKLGSYGKAVV